MKALRIVAVTVLLSVVAFGQGRRVTIYPLSHKVEEWEKWRKGTRYVATRYTAIVTVDVDSKSPGVDKFDLYSIHCDVTKTWDHCHELTDSSYSAEITDKHINITAQWGGNQHKAYSDKYDIDDIHPFSYTTKK
jgi:hypothetical protein